MPASDITLLLRRPGYAKYFAVVACSRATGMVSAFVFREKALAIAPNVLICASFMVMELSVALWPLADGLEGALALIALTGVLEGPSLVAAVGVRQRLALPHLRAQIFATIFSLDVAAGAFGSAVAGPIHAGAGTTVTLLCCGVLLCLAGIISLAMGGTEVEAQQAPQGT